MRTLSPLYLVSSLAVAAVFSSCGTLTPTPRLEIEPQADAVLKAMSDKLAAADQFSFRAIRTIDPELVEGRNIKQRARVQVDVSRPNQFRGTTRDSESTREMFYDGSQFLIWDKSADTYATVPTAKTIDKVIDQMETKWGVHPPMADLLVSDPYRSLTAGNGKATLAGNARVGGTHCQHIAVVGEIVDWDIWIATSDSLPRKFSITLKARPGSPQIVGEFSAWNLDESFSSGHFEPRVGKGSTKIEMIPMN